MPKVHSYFLKKLLLLVNIQFQIRTISSISFLHSTCSLLNLYIYLDLENGFSIFKLNYTCLVLLINLIKLKLLGCHL